jgi:hypothetical protein
VDHLEDDLMEHQKRLHATLDRLDATRPDSAGYALLVDEMAASVDELIAIRRRALRSTWSPQRSAGAAVAVVATALVVCAVVGLLPVWALVPAVPLLLAGGYVAWDGPSGGR